MITQENKEIIMNAVRDILKAVGEDVEREGLLETPKRVANMYEELFSGLNDDPKQHLKLFDEKSNDEMVIVKDIPFSSMCEHHLLPFVGKAHIAYIPNGKVVGISKLARTVEVYARRLQIQEQMTNQIADAIEDCLGAKGVFVMVEAEHMCMSARGIKKPGSKTTTFAAKGVFETDENLRRDIIYLIEK